MATRYRFGPLQPSAPTLARALRWYVPAPALGPPRLWILGPTPVRYCEQQTAQQLHAAATRAAAALLQARALRVLPPARASPPRDMAQLLRLWLDDTEHAWIAHSCSCTPAHRLDARHKQERTAYYQLIDDCLTL